MPFYDVIDMQCTNMCLLVASEFVIMRFVDNNIYYDRA